MKPTYVLFVPNTRGPSVSHTTIESARTEAKRLIDLCLVDKVMVCQFVEGIERVTNTRKLAKNPLPEVDGTAL